MPWLGRADDGVISAEELGSGLPCFQRKIQYARRLHVVETEGEFALVFARTDLLAELFVAVVVDGIVGSPERNAKAALQPQRYFSILRFGVLLPLARGKAVEVCVEEGGGACLFEVDDVPRIIEFGVVRQSEIHVPLRAETGRRKEQVLYFSSGHCASTSLKFFESCFLSCTSDLVESCNTIQNHFNIPAFILQGFAQSVVWQHLTFKK